MAMPVRNSSDNTSHQPSLIQTYYITGNYPAVQVTLQELVRKGDFPVSDGDFPYISKQTTRGKSIDVLEVSLPIIEGLRLRRRQGEHELEFTTYQLLNNGLIREMKERGLANEKPVREARQMISALQKR